MKKIILLLVVLGIIAVGGSVLISKNKVSPDELTRPWLEVVQPKVFELAVNQKDKVRELFTGDELAEGAAVEVATGGSANIHFPDGSVARLDGGTKLVIEKGSFDPKAETLSVRLNLIFGRVWSKIIKLTTPESHWEVKTSTAVATVRGTSFGVEYGADGKFSVTGYENSVEVTAIDPDGKFNLERIKLLVEPGKFLEIRKETIAELKKRIANNDIKEAATSIMSATGAVLLEVKAAPQAMLERVWIKRGIEQDGLIDEMIRRIRQAVTDEAEVRMEIRKDLRDRFMELINIRREALLNIPEVIIDAVKDVIETKPTATQPVNTDTNLAPTNNTQTPVTTQPPVNVAPTPTVKPIALSVTNPSESIAKPLKDGTIINFRAIASYSDGSTVDVTSLAKWQVNGGVGVIEKPGVFVARWTADLGDFGSGWVSAWWQDAKTGVNLFAESSEFTIERLRTEEIIPSNSTGTAQ